MSDYSVKNQVVVNKPLLKRAILSSLSIVFTLACSIGYSQGIEYDGGDYCRKSPVLMGENGSYLTVPVDYENPEKGLTEIYHYFLNPFKPELATVILVGGGPGQPSHFKGNEYGNFLETISENKFNILLFDARGVACSQPPSEELYNSRAFLKSENVARDIEQLRINYGITKVTIFGVSYGTVPSTIYAHLFPESIRALILEGAVFNQIRYPLEVQSRAMNYLWTNLSKEKKLKLQQNGNSWMNSSTALIDLLSDSGSTQLKALVEKINRAPVERLNSIQGFVSEIMYSGREILSYNYPSIRLGFTDDNINNLVRCAELADESIQKEKYISITPLGLNISEYEKSRCTSAQLSSGQKYRATEFTFKTPTTYIHGAFDPRVSVEDGRRHFTEVARGRAQFIEFVEGGHSPSMQEFKAAEKSRNRFTVELMQKAFIGEFVSQSEIEKNLKSRTRRK